MTNNALLIIDVQKGFINEYTRELSGKIEKLQNNYANVYAMQFINLEDSMFRKQLNWHKLSLNTQDTELAFKIRPDALVFSKYSYGATPEFIEYLQQQGITSIDVCGQSTDCCVAKIALDLFDNRILPKVLADYCASTAGRLVHERALISLRHIIGKDNVI